MSDPSDRTSRGDDRVSLAPLDPEEALAALLRVAPDDESGDEPDDEREEGPPA